jgi:hypothetical protein
MAGIMISATEPSDARETVRTQSKNKRDKFEENRRFSGPEFGARGLKCKR